MLMTKILMVVAYVDHPVWCGGVTTRICRQVEPCRELMTYIQATSLCAARSSPYNDDVNLVIMLRTSKMASRANKMEGVELEYKTS